VPEDPWGTDSIPSDRADYRCKKLFYYNGCVWGYFHNPLDSGASDAIGYFDTTIGTGQWIVSLIADYSGGFNIDPQNIPPQIIESNNRLLVSTLNGIYCSPKLS
jgi:hypothetical protein